MEPPHPYRVPAHDATAPLRQGEIVSHVLQVTLAEVPGPTGPPTLRTTTHPYLVILTQDCDLEQDFRVRFPVSQPSDKLIPSVLFCEVMTAEEVFGRIRQTNKKLWERIKINKDERYHFLQKVELGCDRLHYGLPELAIDFKRYLTLPTEEVYSRIQSGEASLRAGKPLPGTPEQPLCLLPEPGRPADRSRQRLIGQESSGDSGVGLDLRGERFGCFPSSAVLCNASCSARCLFSSRRRARTSSRKSSGQR